MPVILQLETSSDVCSVAVSNNGILLSIIESAIPNSHSEQITILIKHCIEKAGLSLKEISAVAISDGPGSYTSLRVGASTAKGICYVIGCPLISIDSLLILIHGIAPSNILEGDIIVPMIDARRMEVYTSVYNSQYKQVSPTEALILDHNSFNEYRSETNKLHLCGNGAKKFADIYNGSDIVLHHSNASAAYMTSSALNYYDSQRFNDIAYYTPNYFKAPHITKSLKKLF